MSMDRIEAIEKFVRHNYGLVRSTSKFEKNIYKDIKKDYFANSLKYRFGIPDDKEICDCLIEILIKNEKLFTEEKLQETISFIPFLKMNNIIAANYIVIMNSVSKKYEVKEETDKLNGIKKFEKELELVKKESTQDIEELISQKKEEYRRLPSILDDSDFEEPQQTIEIIKNNEWWEDLNLRDDPFSGPLDGFSTLDKSLYQQIIVETPPIKWAENKLNKDETSIFHKSFLLAGEFGTGKTTFYDFMAPHFTMKQIEPLRIALTDSINEAHYIEKFEKALCIEVIKLSKKYNLQRTGPMIDFEEARIHMLDIQNICQGFFIFIDDLHKHANSDLVFTFLSHLQIIKNNFSRDGINVMFMVAGFPSWREKIKKDSALTGFFDAHDQLTLPEVTPELAALAIKRRLQAFAVNPDKQIEIKTDFLTSVFKRVCSERGIVNIGFRPYIQEAIQRFEQRQFDILNVDINLVDPNIASKIRAILEADPEFATCLQKLIYGGGIQKQSARDMTLRILCEIYLRKGVGENGDFFNANKYYFKRLKEAGFIQKLDRQINGTRALVWMVNPIVERLNKSIISQFQLSMEDYLVPIYSTALTKTIKKKDLSKIEIYEQDVQQWQKHLDHGDILNLSKALANYNEVIFKFAQSSHLSFDDLPATEKVKDTIWMMMKVLIRYESPYLLDISGENNIEGWSIRFRTLQCCAYFLYLLRSAETGSVEDRARLISFADESFGELWSELRQSINVFQHCGIKCYMIPKGVLRTIYSEYNVLIPVSGRHLEYFDSLSEFIAQIESSIRQYLLVSSSLIFGPYNTRLKQYPEAIRKYITKNLISQSNSFDSYNEFVNLNRGNYRLLFQDTDKKSTFYKYIIRPIVVRWDSKDIEAFFEIFGDLNIITSHQKIGQTDETNRDISTFFRLACRIVADMSLRLKELLMTENMIITIGETTNILYGQRLEGYLNTSLNDNDKNSQIPESIFRHDITQTLKIETVAGLINDSDNTFGYIELNMLELEETRIKFGREFSEIVSLITYYLAKNEVKAMPLYGEDIWLKNVK